jgi:hypothetical protein
VPCGLSWLVFLASAILQSTCTPPSITHCDGWLYSTHHPRVMVSSTTHIWQLPTTTCRSEIAHVLTCGDPPCPASADAPSTRGLTRLRHPCVLSCISRVLRDCGKISRRNGLGSLQIKAAKLKHATSGCNKQYVTICHTNKHKYR